MVDKKCIKKAGNHNISDQKSLYDVGYNEPTSKGSHLFRIGNKIVDNPPW